MDSSSEDSSSDTSQPQQPQQQNPCSSATSVDDDQQQVYFVPYRWWKEAQVSSSDSDSDEKGILYTASSAPSYGGPMRLFTNIFNPDLAFNLRRGDFSQNGKNGEVGMSGRDYALVHGDMWLQALKWHTDSKAAMKDGKFFSAAEDDIADVYPLQLRLSVSRENNSLGVRISRKDNAVERFKRACKIFSLEPDVLRIWDFSGRTKRFFLNGISKITKDPQRHQEQDILLELQIYGLSDSLKSREGKKDETLVVNGNSGQMNSIFVRTTLPMFSCEAGSLGLTGLTNLGNTCFMNSALQCLVHTPKIVDYFLGDFDKEINHENPLGMKGEIASAFGDLLRKLWAPGATPVAPRTFKSKLARFAPQFNGYNQHDSQELLSFLLDGLHEDLNRVKCKPYFEAKDGDGRPDEEVADEYWLNHLARNDSIIVDVCQGQYRSTLVCPVCRKVSVTFDPFMYLSLPLPSTSMRTMTLTVMGTNGHTWPSPITITVPKNGKFEDLIQALSTACSLGVDETLLVAEIYNNSIIRYLEEPADSLSLIRDGDQLVAYRLPRDTDKALLVVFMHQQMEEQYICGKLMPRWKKFGVPLVASCNVLNGSDICNLYTKLLRPFLVPGKDSAEGEDEVNSKVTEEILEQEAAENSGSNRIADPVDVKLVDTNFNTELEFYLTDQKGSMRESKILMNELVSSPNLPGKLNVLVCWPDKMAEQYKTKLPSTLIEVFKSSLFARRPQESVSLYKCLDAFLKEEPLGPDDMWFCPVCKEHCQASKKLDLWRLPEILVIHLKRFSYNRYLKNKLETYVDFPVHDFDLSAYITHKCEQVSNRYVLYAISNHYGNMGGGHYTAFVHHGGERWFDFDDSHVTPINEDRIKTSAAYVLFYRRVEVV